MVWKKAKVPGRKNKNTRIKTLRIEPAKCRSYTCLNWVYDSMFALQGYKLFLKIDYFR